MASDGPYTRWARHATRIAQLMDELQHEAVIDHLLTIVGSARAKIEANNANESLSAGDGRRLLEENAATAKQAATEMMDIWVAENKDYHFNTDIVGTDDSTAHLGPAFGYLWIGMQFVRHGSAEQWLAYWIETYRRRTDAYDAGSPVAADPDSVPKLNAIVLRFRSTLNTTLGDRASYFDAGTLAEPLPAHPETQDRFAKAELAKVIQRIVNSADKSPNFVHPEEWSDEEILKNAVRWKEVERHANELDDLRWGYERLVEALKNHWTNVARTPRAQERYDRLHPIDQMELAGIMLTAFRDVEKSRTYIDDVIDPPASTSATLQALYSRSPIHPTNLSPLMKGFGFEADGTFEVKAGSSIWTAAKKAPTAVDLLTGGTNSVLTTYGVFAGAVAGHAQYIEFKRDPANAKLLAAGTTYRELFKTGVDWPQPSSAASGGRGLGWLQVLLAAKGAYDTVTGLSDKTDWETADVAKVLNDLAGVGNALNALGALYFPVPTASAPSKIAQGFATAGKVLTVFGAVLSFVDAGISLHKAYKAKTAEEAWAHVIAAGGAVLSGATLVLAAIGRVPHPAAFIISLIGLFIVSITSALLATAKIEEVASILSRTAFSKAKPSAKARHVPPAKRVQTKRFDDPTETFTYEMTVKRAGKERTEVREDYERQIAILYAQIGAFGVTYDRDSPGTLLVTNARLDLQTTRKLPGFTPEGSTAPDHLLRSLLPAGSSLAIADASADAATAEALGINVGLTPPIISARPGQDGTSSSGTTLVEVFRTHLRELCEKALTNEAEQSVNVGTNIKTPPRIDAVLTLPYPAWTPTTGQQSGLIWGPPDKKIIVRAED